MNRVLSKVIRFYSIGWYVVPVDVVLFLVTCSQLPPAQSGEQSFLVHDLHFYVNEQM